MTLESCDTVHVTKRYREFLQLHMLTATRKKIENSKNNKNDIYHRYIAKSLKCKCADE